MTKNRMFTQPTPDEWEKNYKEKADIYDKNASKLELPEGEKDVLTEKKLLDKAIEEKENKKQESSAAPHRKASKTAQEKGPSPK